MAIGDAKSITAVVKNAYEGDYDVTADTLAWGFVTDTFASIDANAASLSLADLTTVASSGNYTLGEALTTVTWVQAGNVVTLDCDDLAVAADPANPAAVTCLVIYNDTSAADDVMFVVDLTSDGTTTQTTVNGFTDTITGLMAATVN